MSKQWGHGFHTGKEYGEYWGKVFAEGEIENRLSNTSNKLHVLANALKFPAEDRQTRTGLWWEVYTRTVATEIECLAKHIPGLLNGIVEFEKDIPAEPNESAPQPQPPRPPAI